MKNQLVSTTVSPAIARRAARLVDQAQVFRGKRKAKNTLAAYERGWRHFGEFCEDFGVAPLPASPQTVSAFITQLAQGQTLSTIRVKLAAVSYYHREARREQIEQSPGLPEDALVQDPTTSATVSDVLAGITRTIGSAQHGKDAITLDELHALMDALRSRPVVKPGDALRNRRDAEMLALGFSGAFRRSEVVGLNVADVEFRTMKDNGHAHAVMLVTVRRSKADQSGQGFVKVIPATGGKYCPVSGLKLWLKEAEIGEGPLFRKINRGGHVGERSLTPQVLAWIVQEAAQLAGIDKDLGAHTLRAGWVTGAFDLGLSTEEIMSVTGHKTPQMVLRYNRAPECLQVRAIRKVMRGEEK